MSMMTTLSLCVSCEFSRAVFVLLGKGPEPPHFFLNTALLRLNPALLIRDTSPVPTVIHILTDSVSDFYVVYRRRVKLCPVPITSFVLVLPLACGEDERRCNMISYLWFIFLWRIRYSSAPLCNTV